mmetsp:Transcript_18448/g.23582  ORF Transcript_18448/g.23582 Transcript_18448/m.23582 type:complete len:206 (+) Transcript_18448:365-982(+)
MRANRSKNTSIDKEHTPRKCNESVVVRSKAEEDDPAKMKCSIDCREQLVYGGMLAFRIHGGVDGIQRHKWHKGTLDEISNVFNGRQINATRFETGMNPSKGTEPLQHIKHSSNQRHFPVLLGQHHFGIVTLVLSLPFQRYTHLIDRPAHDKDEEIERQPKHDGSSLQCTESIRPSSYDESCSHSTFSECPEDTLQVVMFLRTIGG